MSMKGTKQLMKQYPMQAGGWDSLSTDWAMSLITDWTQYKFGDSTFFYQADYIDLTGMTMEELTIQLQGIALQRPYEPILAGLGGEVWTKPVQLHCWITSTSIDIERYLRVAASGSFPSFFAHDSGGTSDKASALDWTNLMFGETVTYSTNSNIGLTGTGFMVPLYSKLYGSNEPSANDKLYIYTAWRIAEDAAIPAASLTLPEIRVAIAAEIYEEKELAWIERMRRSYVQQSKIGL